MFAHKLALAFGRPDVDVFLEELSSTQLLDWQAFASKCGLPHYRDDVHFGLLASLIYNANRGDGDPAEPPGEFMPYHDPFEHDVSVEQMKAQIRSALHR